jgi:hypothetical protein
MSSPTVAVQYSVLLWEKGEGGVQQEKHHTYYIKVPVTWKPHGQGVDIADQQLMKWPGGRPGLDAGGGEGGRRRKGEEGKDKVRELREVCSKAEAQAASAQEEVQARQRAPGC